MSLVGASPAPEMDASELQPGVSNYFFGNDPSKWRTNVPHYSRIRYRDVYPGIDLVFYGSGTSLEYDFVVRPGADPSRIRLAYHGTGPLTVDRGGDLVAVAGGSELRLRKPVVYQEISGERVPVTSSYEVAGGAHQARVKLGAYDTTRAVVIDPTLSYSTYLGGTASDQANGIAVDSSGSAYITGSANSLDFPLAAPMQGTNPGAPDVFVAKLNPAGTALVYSTYIGGTGSDSSSGIALDSSGNAYVTGTTASADFPLMNPYQSALAGPANAFVVKLNSTGSALLYATYLGGSGNDAAHGIAVDPTGAAIIVGSTSSSNFPLAGAQQGTLSGTSNAFITKLNSAGSALLYSTYFGNFFDTANGVATDPNGNAYVVGGTGDACVLKLNTNGIAIYSTCLGGGSGNAIAVDASGNAYIAGATNDLNFPVVNAVQPQLAYGGCFPTPFLTYDAFIAKLNSTGSALVYSTYLGGAPYKQCPFGSSGGDDFANGIAVDAIGNAYVTGSTTSHGFPVLNPLQKSRACSCGLAGACPTTCPAVGLVPADAFVANFDPSGALIYSTFLGGTSDDSGNAIATDHQGNAYVAGVTASTDFPVVNALQGASSSSGTNAFVAKLSLPESSTTLPVGVTLTSTLPDSVIVTGQGCGAGTYALPITLYWNPAASCTIAVTVTAQSSGGTPYLFSGWGDGSTANPRTFTAPWYSATYTINWAAEYLLRTSVSPAGSGSITASPASQDGFYPPGTTVTLTAVPNPGYAFSFFSGDLVGVPNPQSLTLSAPRTVTATFSCTYSLSATSVPAPAAATAQSVTVTTGAGCAWTASSNTPWMTITAGGTGSGSATFSLAANSGASVRAGTLTVAGQTVTVTQGWGNAISIYNTGVTAAGGLAADGSADSHYSLISSADPAYPGPNALVVNSSGFPFPPWLTNGTSSKWIGPRADAGSLNPPGTYTYRTRFDLTGMDPTGAVLSGQCTADDSSVIQLNGNAVGTCATYGGWSPFAIGGGFVSGVNTLDFVVSNNGSTSTPTGLRVEIVGTAPPIPGTQRIPSKVGVFRSGFLWLLDADGNQQFNAPPDKIYAFGGIPGDIPITGDWSGSGTTKVGVYRSSNGLFLLDYDGDGQFTSADKVYNLGVGTQPGDIPVVGDWNGDGRTKVGIFRQGFYWILDTNGNGTFDAGDQAFAYGGVAGDMPVVGDWNGSGTSKVGIFRAGFLWILDTNGNHTVDAGDQVFPFGGITGDVPVVGDWNGDGRTKVGVFRMGFFWVLDTNGNQTFDPGIDQAFAFGGIAGDIPVVGKW
jgi:hypothetical protein